MSDLWKNLFLKLGVSLLFSTAYHSQTDGQSEATNKYLQTMLRFFVNERQDDWALYLSEAEFLINNSTTASMKMSPNEVLFGFKLWTNIAALGQDLAAQDNPLLAPALRSLARADAEDASHHAAYHMARGYNNKHKEISLNVGDKAYIRLGNGYKLRGIPKAKLSLQRVGPFEIVAKVGTLAYELRLPDDWRIHHVISIAQLEPAKPDPFQQEFPPPPPITVEGEEEYEIDSIVRTDMRGRGRNRRKHYLVRWKGYGPESDQWIPVEEMEHAGELIAEFEDGLRDKRKVQVVA
jgi:hypothetical protein